MNKIIIIGLIVLVAWLWLSSRKKEAVEEKAPAKQSPVDIAQAKIAALQKTIEEKLPRVSENIGPVVDQAQKIIDDFQKEIAVIEKQKQYEAPVLVYTQVAPDEMQPQGKFFSVVKEAQLNSNTMVPKPKVLPENSGLNVM